MSLFDINGKPLDGQVDETPKTTQAPVKKIPYEHQQVLNQMLKTIAACPMDVELKQILRMRIWGIDPKVFDPMSCEQIAQVLRKEGGGNLKVKARDVERWEEDAMYNISKFLDRENIIVIHEKFNRDNNIKDIMGNN